MGTYSTITSQQLALTVCGALGPCVYGHSCETRAMDHGAATVTFKHGRWFEVTTDLLKGSSKHFPGLDYEDVDAETEVAEFIGDALDEQLPIAIYPDAQVHVAFINGHVVLASA